MPLQATSGTASYDAFGGGVAVEPVYIEQIFQTYLYTGNGSTQTITNGIDASGKGAMTWIKNRSTDTGLSVVHDTARGTTQRLSTNLSDAQVNLTGGIGLTAFNSNGFTVGTGTAYNGSGNNLVSWTFRKQPKFFDVVTYTGNGTSGRVISHSLGSTPGCIIIKRTNTTGNWATWHRSLTSLNYGLYLNTTDSEMFQGWFSNVDNTSFTISGSSDVNANGSTYVAYLFAHDAGGFGLTGTDNVISCGSYTGNGSTTGPVITLGYEPQWLMVKKSSGSGDWVMLDNMRGIVTDGIDPRVWANLSSAENTGDFLFKLNATGFQPESLSDSINASSQTYIYIAIRRGPMKVPTSGTSVFAPALYTGTGSTNTITSPFPSDLLLVPNRAGQFYSPSFWDRLRGATKFLRSPGTDAEATSTDGLTSFGAGQNSVAVGADATYGNINFSGRNYVPYSFRRAPSTFDEVCWIGDGNNPRSLNHNLAVAPELIITKKRNSTSNWITGFDFASTTYKYFNLNDTGAAISDTYSSSPVYGGQPTASVFVVGNQGNMNISGDTYVTYMWATNAGVTKVGSYTGNGSSQTINCGFTGGSRFVLIKRTNSSGDWYVWDSARGIVSGNDPHLSLNTTAAEVTTDDTIDTDSTGFIVNQVSATNCNVNGASYIFLSYA